jgi:hypothetical protein
MTLNKSILTMLLLSLVVSTSNAQILYSEAFDSLAADVTVLQTPDSHVDYVDYSNFGFGNLTFNIPESPRMIPGSADTKGIALRVNKGDDNPAAAAVNILAGNSPMTFTGDYKVSFDMWMNVPVFTRPLTGMLGIPANGSTELGSWGVGSSDAVPNARPTRAIPDGTFGWVSNENGFGTEDAAFFANGVELCDLGDTQFNADCWPDGDQSEPFNMSFDAPISPGAPNNAAGNSWVEVDVIVQGGNVSLRYNGVEWFNHDSAFTDGNAFFGYGDPFTSITQDDDFADAADGMFALYDNFVIMEVVPEPASGLMVLFGLAMVMIGRRR